MVYQKYNFNDSRVEGRLKLCIILMTCMNFNHIDCYCISGILKQLSSTIVDFYLFYDGPVVQALASYMYGASLLTYTSRYHTRDPTFLASVCFILIKSLFTLIFLYSLLSVKFFTLSTLSQQLNC